MPLIRWVLGVGATAALMVGCGGEGEVKTAESPPERPRQEARPFEVTLNGYAGPENAGIVMAEELGYFDDAGLEVSAYKPLSPVRPLKYVATGEVDLAVSYEPQVVLAQEEHVPVVAVGSLVSQPTAAMIWLEKSKIDGIGDLRGKTIAIPGLNFQRDLLRNLLARAGLTLADVTVRRVDYDLVPALVSGRADAIFGGAWNLEGAELEARGLDPVITRVSSLGVPPYEELVLVARRDRLARDPQSIRDFMSALARGTASALEKDPAFTAGVILDVSEKENRKAMEAEVEATLPLLSKSGRMSPARASELVSWMKEEGLIERAPPVPGLLTNRYLEPQP